MQIKCKNCGYTNHLQEKHCRFCSKSLREPIKTEIVPIYSQANEITMLYFNDGHLYQDEPQQKSKIRIRLILLGGGITLVVVLLLQLLLPLSHR